MTMCMLNLLFGLWLHFILFVQDAQRNNGNGRRLWCIASGFCSHSYLLSLSLLTAAAAATAV